MGALATAGPFEMLVSIVSIALSPLRRWRNTFEKTKENLNIARIAPDIEGAIGRMPALANALAEGRVARHSPPMRRFVFALPLLLAASVALAAPAEKKKGGGETFIQLPSLTATIFRADGRRGVLTVDVGLDIPDGALRQRATISVPLLRAAYTQALLIYAPGIPPGAPPNPDMISVQLQRATDQTLGRPGAKLLLGTILEN